ncbi:MAG: hypothetical protein ACHQAY_26120 [Hyphomicrobiales bacterium]
MNKLKTFVAVAAVLAFAGAAAAETMISQADMEAAFKGKSFKDDDGAGNVGVITYGADMTIHVKVATGPQSPADDGKYRFANGGYCSSWTKLRSGAEKCFTASKLATGFQLWTADGKKDDTLTSQ